MEFNWGGVGGSESLIEVEVVDLHIVNDLCLVVEVGELDLTAKIGVVDEDKMSMRSSLSKVCCVLFEESHDFVLKIYRRE